MAAATPAALDARPTLSGAVLALLKMLARGAPRDGTIELREHGGADNQRVCALPVPSAGHSYLPELVLGIYETSAAPWSVTLGVRAPGGVSVATLVVSRAFVRGFHPIKGPTGRTLPSSRWTWPAEEIEAYEVALAAWPCPPTMLMRSLPSAEVGQVVALWAIAEPVRDPVVALETLRTLARVFGGDVPGPRATIADVDFPLPGTNAANQDSRVTEVVVLNVERVYGLAEINAAISAAGRKK